MALPVSQSLFVDHISMLLLLQRIFSEVSVLTLLYSIVVTRMDTSLVLEDFFSRLKIPPII